MWSAAYAAWRTQAYLHWLEQRMLCPVRNIPGFYFLEMWTYPPDLRWRDMGNLEKGVNDFLQATGIIDNDRMMRRFHHEWADQNDAPLGCRLYVRPWTPRLKK